MEANNDFKDIKKNYKIKNCSETDEELIENTLKKESNMPMMNTPEELEETKK